MVYTKAAVMLHNFLRTTESLVYCRLVFTDKEDGEGNVLTGASQKDFSSQGLETIHNTGSNNHSINAANVRDIFKDYFSSSHGEVSWQYRHACRTN